MAKTALNYGVLKGTVAGHLRDADDDHYQILVSAGSGMFRLAVNVHSSVKPPDLRFETISALPAVLTRTLSALPPGFRKTASQPGGLAQDYVRGGLVKIGDFKIVPGNRPGAANDLKDTLEDAVLTAMGQAGSFVYAFGARWGPESKKDEYFKFSPGGGVHDIHMNQGNDPSHAGEDGVFHDGCLIFQYPGGQSRAFFLAFQSQSFNTDDHTGHAKKSTPPAGRPRRRKAATARTRRRR
jgi:uncharacterized protein YukJ